MVELLCWPPCPPVPLAAENLFLREQLTSPALHSDVCDTVIAGGDPTPAPAHAKKLAIEELSLEERIRRRAYELYVERGNESGSELDDWLQAEKEIQRAKEQAVGKS
jgi:Protein of unknown function (DUF2934)